jgi:hypothetical protein
LAQVLQQHTRLLIAARYSHNSSAGKDENPINHDQEQQNYQGLSM